MSLLNLALQHCGYARDPCLTVEQSVKRCNTMKALRDLGEEDDDVREEWLESMAGCKREIKARFSRLKQKGKQVSVQKVLANDDDVRTFQKYVVREAGYDMQCTTKAEYNKPRMS